PIDEIEFGIVGARAPCRSSSLCPGVGVLWPCFGTGLAGRRNCVSPPEFLTRVRIPSIKEATGCRLSTGDTGNQHSIGYDRRPGGVVALARVGEFLVPKLLAGLHVEGEHMIVDRHAKDFAVINRRRASVESGTLDARFKFHWRTPDLSAGFHVDGKGPLTVDHI